MKTFIKFLSMILYFVVFLDGNAVEVWKRDYLLDYPTEFERKRLSEFVNYDLGQDEKVSNKKFYSSKKALAYYRSFFEEGETLKNYCEKQIVRPIFISAIKKDQIKRSMVATLQYLGLNLVVDAIGKYALKLNFTKEQFNNLTKRLIKNNCSQNISVISLRDLEKKLQASFFEKNNMVLPSFSTNAFFPEFILQSFDDDKATEQEMLHTVKLFRSFCTWNNEANNLRLLGPLVRNPGVMALVMRHMNGKKLVWWEKGEQFYLEEDKGTVQVLCEGLMCRKTDKKKFDERIPKAVTTFGRQFDFERIYCQDFYDKELYSKGNISQIKKWLESETEVTRNLLVAQFVALLTKIPDLLVRAEKFSQGTDFLRSSLDKYWEVWTDRKKKTLSNYLNYEDSLSVEAVTRNLYFNRFVPDFKVVFDVNLGEFDRINQMAGKLKTSFSVKLSKSYLKWLKKKTKDVGSQKNDLSKVMSGFKKKISEEVEKARKKFKFPPWKGDLAHLIVKELLIQLNLYSGRYFDKDLDTMVSIPIEMNFAPFALKYMRYLHKIEENKEKMAKFKTEN